jgi:hypothetical protein
MSIVTARDDVIPVEGAARLPNRAARGICAAFLFALAVILVFVLVTTAVDPWKLMKLNERRDPGPLPRIAMLLDSPATFAERLNRWFDDRVGFRDPLIRVKNQIDFSVFRVSRKVYIGRSGWLFERATTDARLLLERLSAPAFSEFEESFVQFAELLARHGIKLVVVGYPDKSMLYPEFLPAGVPRPSDGGKYDRLRRFLAAQPDIIFIDGESVLQAAKGDKPLFYKTDIHPTAHGSIAIVKEIVRRIAAAAGRSDIEWNERFTWRQIFWDHGAEARFLAVLSDIGEQVEYAPEFYVVGKNPPGGHWIEDPRRIDVPYVGRLPVFDWEFVSDPENCAQRLPGAVLYGNSFSDEYVSLGLYNYFCFLRRSRTPRGRLAPYVADIPVGTKYFIYQYTASYLPGEAPILDTDSATAVPSQFWGAVKHE